jgi:RNA polymerase sigma factor (sigma-70 family)
VEASALHAPPGLSRLPLAIPLLRLRSDEQLVALFRAGSDEAFRVLHDRYRQRLFAYVRRMLPHQSRQDAEDVLQDVFVRAFGALRGDSRAVNVRAWLYRVAHNRCIDHLRRPLPPAAEIFEMSRKPLLDPVDEAQRRDDLRRLVGDVGRLPEQQRSALLMREIDGLSYAELAGALDVTVPAVKSLLVRARVGLVEAQESRDADCGEIRRDLMASYDRGVKASGRARRHMRECDGCREYRRALRGVRRSFAALTPVGAGPAALLAQLIGVGGAGGGAAAAGGGGGAVLAGGAATATACKVAAVVCATAITAGGAVEVRKLTGEPAPKRERAAASAGAADARRAAPATPIVALPVAGPVRSAHAPAAPVAVRRELTVHQPAPGMRDDPIVAPAPDPVTGEEELPVPVGAEPQVSSGGTAAPDEQTDETAAAAEPATGTAPEGSAGPAAETELPGAGTPDAEPSPEPEDPALRGGTAPPPAEH